MPNYAVQRRRGTTSEHSSFTGLAGELTIDTTKDTVVVHDGSTAGGISLLREDVDNLAADAISGDKVHGGTISGSVALANGATAATQSAGNDSTLIATTAFVTAAVGGEDTLAEMGDVALVSATSGDMLVHDGSNWVDVTMSGDATMAANGAVTIAANSVELGTDTTGNYVASLTAGTGVTVGGAAEGGTPSVAIGQAVATTSDVTFNNLIVDGTLTVNGSTTTVDTTNILIEDPLMFLSSGATGSASVDAGMIVERGDDTNVGFIWDETADQWAAINTTETGGTAGNVTISSYANMRCDTLTGTATAAQYSDLAERYESDQMYTAGTVVCFGGNAEITQSTELYDSKVAGVISTNPAHLMNAQAGTNETHPAVALTGRVPCKVMGTVRKGDLMVTSAQPGVAMSADERVPGTIIGKAIQNYTDSGIGVIEILVTLM
tara:strand:+ start:451 stop:1761 length:1311 start_codon:yes stop_codon:yes gene_type:complete